MSGGTGPDRLAALAAMKAQGGKTPTEQRPDWYALWTDVDPDAAIRALEARLEALATKPAARFAEAFVVSLLGGRRESAPILGAFRTPDHLAKLYVLMHRHIRVSEDIERAGKGVYSPTLRDDAQDARGRLFSLLSEIPGEPTYRAMLKLASEHPAPAYRAYMRRQARDRAVADGDIEGWSVDDMRALIGRLAMSHADRVS